MGDLILMLILTFSAVAILSGLWAVVGLVARWAFNPRRRP